MNTVYFPGFTLSPDYLWKIGKQLLAEYFLSANLYITRNECLEIN